MTRICLALAAPVPHLWYTDEPTYARIPGEETCPVHSDLPFHNGPDDRFAQEDE